MQARLTPKGGSFAVMEALSTRLQAGMLELVESMQILLQEQAELAVEAQRLLPPEHAGASPGAPAEQMFRMQWDSVVAYTINIYTNRAGLL